MFDEIIKNHKTVEKLKIRRKIEGKLSIQVCFDRAKPTVKLYDGVSNIELTIGELEALQKYKPI
jgi:hypothetical protein